ncbi:ferredoxin [Streptomyces sp. MNU77]|uniref:ferredoxin n=1 Tax=Streptomyces sp. MNU77 TaxID=1573406 RepID=UPI0005E3EEA7|nr:ferredoxin [Streptomyces sp. MNU77]OLO25804.1 ferredoxin [Streptomyces sp. MNU77]
MKIRVDGERCMGHAMCNAIAPEVYEVNDMGYNEMGEFEVAGGAEAAAVRGADSCPERVISVLDGNRAR